MRINWQANKSWCARKAPKDMTNWLTDPGSLTERLINASNGRFAVQVLAQGWHRPMLDEVQRLHMPSLQTAWVREVLLTCDSQAVVYARSVIPRTTATCAERRLLSLGSRPLGGYLFAQPSMQREAPEYAGIRVSNFPRIQPFISGESEIVWGRRSVFTLHKKPLLVAEIFLPPILNYNE